MASNYYYPTSKNSIQKQLSAQLLSTASTGDAITFDDVDGVQNKPGVLVINRINSNGTSTPSSREYISYSGTSGTTVLIETRNVDSSGAARTHAVGSIVEFVSDAVWAQRVIDQALVEHNVTGTHSVANMITGGSVKDEDDMSSNSATALATQQSIKAYVDTYGQFTSLSRQAIINGNFDVWQRGTSVSITDATTIFQADRWSDYAADDGGTLPTLTRARVALTAGQLANTYYASKLNTNGAGTSLGNNSVGRYATTIENGVRYLCGLNKTVTVSFYASSSIASKKIAVALYANYGSGGSPSAAEYITPQVTTLTSNLTKYTYTFTTNTLVGKTFGTANDDYLQLAIIYQWGSTNNYGVPSSETYVGAGDIYIAQVQLCAGSVDLPFQPKSYEEELRACQRYYELLTGQVGMATSATTGDFGIVYKVAKRRAAVYTDFAISTAAANVAELGVSTRTLNALTAVAGSTVNGTSLSAGGASGMTTGKVLVTLSDLLSVSVEL